MSQSEQDTTTHSGAGLYDEVCTECDGQVCIEGDVYWPLEYAKDDAHACAVCGGTLDTGETR